MGGLQVIVYLEVYVHVALDSVLPWKIWKIFLA